MIWNSAADEANAKSGRENPEPDDGSRPWKKDEKKGWLATEGFDKK